MVLTVQVWRTIVLAVAIALTLLATFLFGVHFNDVRSASMEYLYSGNRTQNFHLLLPAPSADEQSCKFLLSSGIVGYPEPTFLGWEGHGMFNGTESQLFKVSETLTYLRSLPPDQDDDLVLVLDAYNIWAQLPPEVLIKRYHRTINALNDRLKREGLYGKKVYGAQIKNSVIFGADKVCWPQPFEHAACWAVANSTDDPNLWGPDTDTEMFKNRPRWLNSGTVMGPVKDVRDVYGATMDMISKRFEQEYNHHGEDQYYFAEVFAEQEVRRTIIRDGNITKFRPNSVIPKVDTNRRTEFGITLDYGTDLFLGNDAYDRAITWIRYNHTTPDTQRVLTGGSKRVDQWRLTEDISSLPGPYAATDPFDDMPRHLSWQDVMLGSNCIKEGQVFPFLYLTGDRTFRDRWWPRLWFHPNAEKLLLAKKRQQAMQPDPDVFAVVDGVRWKSTPPPHASKWDRVVTIRKNKKSGVWTDRGGFVPFEQLCGQFENSTWLYQKQEKEEQI